MSTTVDHLNLHPQTQVERDSVLTELRGILSSVHFCNSKRYPAFLKYVVEQTLAGHEEALKERTIGVEVFDRPATYDTYADAVVRFTAGEVRKRLAAYYHDSPRTSELRISLPLGTYVPNFFVEAEPEISHEQHLSGGAEPSVVSGLTETNVRTFVSEEPLACITPEASVIVPSAGIAVFPIGRRLVGRFVFLGGIGVLILLATSLFWFFRRSNSLDQFWGPLLHDRKTVLLCAGGNTLASRQESGLVTADKATAYPYFSLQTIESVSRLSSFLDHNGSTPVFNFAASTPLPELDSHAIILLNAYNNPWTMRLVEPLRFHFSPDTGSIPDQAIVDRNSPGVRWRRDSSVADLDTNDYALIARFWDTVTDNWILVLAGLGKNGTEAATQFVITPHYAQLLRDRIGGNLGNRNVEVVLKVNVFDGKTGLPSIIATHVW